MGVILDLLLVGFAIGFFVQIFVIIFISNRSRVDIYENDMQVKIILMDKHTAFGFGFPNTYEDKLAFISEMELAVSKSKPPILTNQVNGSTYIMPLHITKKLIRKLKRKMRTHQAHF